MRWMGQKDQVNQFGEISSGYREMVYVYWDLRKKNRHYSLDLLGLMEINVLFLKVFDTRIW
jgi:hypothetical protein